MNDFERGFAEGFERGFKAGRLSDAVATNWSPPSFRITGSSPAFPPVATGTADASRAGYLRVT